MSTFHFTFYLFEINHLSLNRLNLSSIKGFYLALKDPQEFKTDVPSSIILSDNRTWHLASLGEFTMKENTLFSAETSVIVVLLRQSSQIDQRAISKRIHFDFCKKSVDTFVNFVFVFAVSFTVSFVIELFEEYALALLRQEGLLNAAVIGGKFLHTKHCHGRHTCHHRKRSKTQRHTV